MVREERKMIFLLSFTCKDWFLFRFLFLLVLGIGCVILLWHALCLPYNHFCVLKQLSLIVFIFLLLNIDSKYLLKHRLWILVRTASTRQFKRNHNLCFEGVQGYTFFNEAVLMCTHNQCFEQKLENCYNFSSKK